MRISFFSFLGIALLALISCVDKPSSIEDRGRIVGIAIDETGNNPLPGVSVSIQANGTKITDLNGYYSFAELESGAYTVTAVKTGYVSQQASVSVESNTTKTVDFSMRLAKAPRLLLSLNSVNFGLADTQIQVFITNGGDEDLTWQVQSDEAWITLQPSSGTTSSETDQLILYADRSALDFGQHTANLTFTSNGGSAIIPVSIQVAQFVATPIFNPPAGIFPDPQIVSIQSSTSGAQIRYTLDGSEPNQSSLLYSTALAISASVMVKAKAYKSGYSPSSTSTANYVIAQTVSSPSFIPSGGVYSSAQMVSILCLTEGAEIRYTINGTEPNGTSTLYTNPIYIYSSLTVKAKAFKNGWNPSPISTAVYSIIVMQTVANPVISPSGGTYNSAQTIYLSCSTPGSEIRYTLDATSPTENSALFTGPFQLGAVSTLKAKAYKSGWNPSSIVSASYHFPTGFFEDFEGSNTWSMQRWHNTNYPPGNWTEHGTNWVEWDNWYVNSFPNSITKTVFVQDCNRISFDLKRYHYAGVSLYVNGALVGSATTNGTHVFSRSLSGYITIKFVGIGDYVSVGDTVHLDNIRVFYE